MGIRASEMLDGYLTVMKPSKRPPIQIMMFWADSLLPGGVCSKAVSLAAWVG